jgi:hypothetical protein
MYCNAKFDAKKMMLAIVFFQNQRKRSGDLGILFTVHSSLSEYLMPSLPHYIYLTTLTIFLNKKLLLTT